MASTKHETSRSWELLAKMTSPATNLLTGAAFGSTLALSGVYSPSVIISQMELRNFHMLQSFLTASSISILVVQLAIKTGYLGSQTRTPLSLLNLPPYSANVLGGLLIGTNMAVTGACPGTVLVQIAVGSISGLQIGLGALLGGIAFTRLAPLLNHRSAATPDGTAGTSCGADPTPDKTLSQLDQYTVQGKLGVETRTVVTVYEALCIGVVALAAYLLPNDPTSVNPIIGGLVIGGAQTITVLLSRKIIGISAAYLQLGNAFWDAITPSPQIRSSSRSAVWFAIGALAGAKALARQVPALVPNVELEGASPLTSVVGGMAMVFGAGLAAGCPSGHGISGMATLSLASFVTVAAMFAGGMGWKALIG